MRVVKRLYSNDESTILASRIFDDVIRKTELPLNFDVLEFNLGYGSSYLTNNKASVGLDLDNPLLIAHDKRAVRTLIIFELYRLVIRENLEFPVPRLVEDIIIGRDMVRNGYADDLTYVFYVFMAQHGMLDAKNYIQYNMPWIIFHGHDSYYSDMFKQMSKNRARSNYDLKVRKLFNALKKDLRDAKNLKNAVAAYESTMESLGE